MPRPIIGIQGYDPATCFYQRFVIALMIIDPRLDSGATAVSEIKFGHACQLRQCLYAPATPREVPGKLFLTGHVVRIQFKGVSEFFLRLGEVPLVPPIQPSKGTVGLAESLIQFQRFTEGFPGVRICFLWRHPSLLTHIDVTVRQSHICECKAWIFLNGLLEKHLCFSEPLQRTRPPLKVRTSL